MRRDYPLRFFWGIFISFMAVATTIATWNDEPETEWYIKVFVGAVFLAVGVLLVRSGWAIAQARPRRG